MAITRKALVKVLLLAGMLIFGLTSADQQQEKLLQRNKRTLTTICVEIQPSGPQTEPYFMCRGTGNQGQQDVGPTSNNQAAGNYGPAYGAQTVQSKSNHQEQGQEQQQQQTPAIFPSFPVFGAGFFQASTEPAHENLYNNAEGKTSQASQLPPSFYGSAFSTSALAPSSAAESYGPPAVSYSSARGSPAAAHGTTAGASSAPPAAAYAGPANEKQTSTAQQSKSQSKGSPAVGGYDSLLSTRQHMPLDGLAMALPNTGFQMQELNQPAAPLVAAGQTHLQPIDQPMVMVTNVGPQFAALVPMAQVQFQQPTTMTQSTPDFYDDPVMRAFYKSVPQPQQAPAPAPIQQQGGRLPTTPWGQVQRETILGHAPTAAYSNDNSQSAMPPSAPAVAPPTQPEVQPSYAAYPKSSQLLPQVQGFSSQPMQVPTSVASNAFSDCKPPCQNPTRMQCCDNGLSYASPCPSYQPVIITMPCYAHQEPSHYLAAPSARPTQPGSPQVGSSNDVTPTLGTPFGMPPILNPFGPLGNLNPFNPFNRLLGTASPAATLAPQPSVAHPLQRLFNLGGQAMASTEASTIIPAPTTNAGKLNFVDRATTVPPSSTTNTVPGLLGSPRVADLGSNGNDDDIDDDDDENDDKADEQQQSGGSAADSVETDTTKGETKVASDESVTSQYMEKLSVKELVDKAEEKINMKGPSKEAIVKREKQKRRNAPSSGNGNGNSQKRKYLQRL